MKKKSKNKKIIIFGSSGFIASSLILKLKKEKLGFLAFSKSNYDLTKNTSINKIKDKINPEDIIVFISAKAPVKDIKMLIDNLSICNNFVEILKDNPTNHIIYISSDAVYSDSMFPLKENSPTLPLNLHGIMHLNREIILQQYFKNLSILRPTLIYGFNDPHNGYGPNSFYRNAITNKDITLFGRGEELRDHVFITDVVEAIYQVIIQNKIGKYNVTSGKLISFYEIAEKIISHTKSNSKILTTKRTSLIPHNGYRSINNSKIRKTLKINFLNFTKGLQQYEI